MAKRGLGKGAETYADELVCQAIGVAEDDYTSYDMERGIMLEPLAIETYEAEKLVSVKQKQRRTHPKYRFISGEADGVVGDRGGIEVKCPNSKNHLQNIIDAAQIAKYEYQMQGYMWIYDLNWMDFVSYDPRFPVEHEISIHRVWRDQDTIDLLEDRCVEFWKDYFRPRLRSVLNYDNKVSDQDVRDIRGGYEDGYLMSSLAIEFGISTSMVSSIINRKTYKHVT